MMKQNWLSPLCGEGDLQTLTERAQTLRDRLTDSDFEKDLLDHNADYIDSFVAAHANLDMPLADVIAPGKAAAIILEGVRVTAEIHFRLRRLTKSNKIRVGAGMLRYAKGRPLPAANAEWQCALLLGYLKEIGIDDGAEPEGKLCITLDAYSGQCHAAPTNSIKRFNDIKAACASIAERWPNIPPPPNAAF